MKKTLLLLAASIFLVQPSVYAASIQGIIQHVDNTGRMLSIQRTDSGNQDIPKQLEVKILSDAKFKNASSLDDLKNGQEVKLDVKNNQAAGYWDAKSIEVTNATPSASQESQTDQPKMKSSY